ncbi:hydrophobe/amphiphile efflux-1 family RND transporter, partial [bacterium]
MISQFFIDRPKFALVISIIILLIGGISIPLLPVESMPDVTPPTISVTANFPGADAVTLEQAVTAPIEQEINGVENMIYLNSKSSSAGSLDMTVTFDIGTDVDMAQVLTQNRVGLAEPKLPEDVKKQGVKVEKQSTAMVGIICLYSPNGTYDELYISNYIATRLKDPIARINGVGKVTVFGAKDFSMRIWLNPELLKARGITPDAVTAALRAQNVQVAGGQIGAQPNPGNLNFQYNVLTKGRLLTEEEFGNIVVKTGDDGEILYLRDVARIELGAQDYYWYAERNGSSAIAMGLYQTPGSNALAVLESVLELLDEAAADFPDDLEYEVTYSPTEDIEASIAEVIETLLIAIALVIFVVWIFLQDWRLTLIPAITIPVSLIGTFAVMLGLGMSMNNLSLFGIVLVIGIVVDDAIVVVENAVRLMAEKGWDAHKAISEGMLEVTGPVIATTLVLLAVFVPTLMMPGLTGLLYKQFATTISVATVFSSINALTLSPALCRLLLKPASPPKFFLFVWFNRIMDKATDRFTTSVTGMLRKSFMVMAIYGGLCVATWFGISSLPGGFLPDEDQGYFFMNAQLPDGSSLDRTHKVMDEVTSMLQETPGVAKFVVIGGFSLLDGVAATNSGMAIVTMDNWSDRPGKDLHVNTVMQKLQRKLFMIQEARVFSFLPPPIMGLGTAGGFTMELQDRGGAGINRLQQAANDMVTEGNKSPLLTRMNQNFRAGVPQLFLDVDRTKALAYKVPLDRLFSTLGTSLGSAYVNDFNLFGRTWRVQVQADEAYRAQREDVGRIEVRSDLGYMVPLDAVATVRDTVGPLSINRFNLYPGSTVTGSPTPGTSSGEALAELERIAARVLPPTMGYEWSGVTYQQLAAGNMAPIIFSLAFIFVYLFMVAQYESWTVPLSVLLAVPMAILGAAIFTMMRGMDNNIYTQIG